MIMTMAFIQSYSPNCGSRHTVLAQVTRTKN